MKRRDKKQIIDDFVEIYRLLTSIKQSGAHMCTDADKKLYTNALTIKDSLERVIEENKLNDTSFLLLKKQLDTCLVEYYKSSVTYNESLFQERLDYLSQNIARYSN